MVAGPLLVEMGRATRPPAISYRSARRQRLHHLGQTGCRNHEGMVWQNRPVNQPGRKQRLRVIANQDDCLRQDDQPGDGVIVDLPGQVLVALARWGGLPISLHICAAWLGHTQAVADIHYRMTGTFVPRHESAIWVLPAPFCCHSYHQHQVPLSSSLSGAYSCG